MYITPERSVLVSKVTKRKDVYDTGSESLRLILDDGVEIEGSAYIEVEELPTELEEGKFYVLPDGTVYYLADGEIRQLAGGGTGTVLSEEEWESLWGRES